MGTRVLWLAKRSAALAATVMLVGLVGVSAAAAAPVNDNFPGIAITGASGSIDGTNIGATLQPMEPTVPVLGGSEGATVWYSWTATGTGTETFTTCGGTTNFDTVLAAYTGNSVNGLTLLDGNDDDNTCGFINASRITFNAVAGATYRIQVGGFRLGQSNPAQGNFTLTWFGGTPAADLSVAKTCTPNGSGPQPGNAIPGQDITCQIAVTNNGPSPAQNVAVTDTAPAGTTTQSIGGGGFSCATGTPTSTCTIPTLNSGQTAIITAVFRVDQTVGPNTPLTNKATVSSATADPNTNNNSSSSTVNTVACTITGTPDADIIQATSGNQVICGLNGDDYIVAKGGNNIIFGGGGNDIITGGSGNDIIFGGAGDDTINGGGGIDQLYGQAGNDTLNAQDNAGGDIVDGGPGAADTCNADPGDTVSNCEF